ncbi:MAG TPA: tetratricopeptide repeat protein [Candidatus Acidoferrum sp.]|nr:tetratricopeptide repeat protein [Candidatus Acidoferrum sp.]
MFIGIGSVRLIVLTLLGFFFTTIPLAAQESGLDQEFQAAVSEYNAGHFAEAAAKLEPLVTKLPNNFEVQELLGLVYSAQSQDASANPHLAKAVQLNPNSAAARTNLAANLVRLGKVDLAGEQFKKAAELDPKSYDTNHNLAEYLIQSKKVPEAIPYLERAQRSKPDSYDNGYDLALAYLLTKHFAQARAQITSQLKLKDTPELHNLLGSVEEEDGKFVEAANQYELAAHADPSESNLFDWGSELLIHRTLGPAIEVFRDAITRYPSSARLAIGLGMAYYGHGNYDDAVKSLIRAADLDPTDPNCYVFLSKAYDSSPSQVDEVVQRFRRFSELQPRNARALYYYAMSLWKGKRAEDPNLDVRQIESLLKKSLELDPRLADAHLQLGNLYSDQHRYEDAVPEYQHALDLNPNLADGHYRLGQAYVRTGKREEAQEQLQVYQKLNEAQLADLERQRAEVRQFVYAEKDKAGEKP